MSSQLRKRATSRFSDRLSWLPGFVEQLRARGVEVRGAPSSGLLPSPISALFPGPHGLSVFDGALLVLPVEHQSLLGADSAVLELLEFCPSGQVFALDLFGGLFAATSNRILRVNPETREVEEHSSNADAWAAKILAQPNFETGWSLATEWQRANRPLAWHERLVPKELFVLGGDLVVENLRPYDLRHAFQVYAGLSAAISGVPDGTYVEFKVKD